MSKTIRVNEYYDLFDVKTVSGNVTEALTNIPDNITPTNEYNTFRGFSNWSDFYDNNKTLTTPPSTYTANNIIEITGKHKSPQASSSINVDDNGDIWCYPPNVSVPYWSKIIFRNFDYVINPDSNTYVNLFKSHWKKFNYPLMCYETGTDYAYPIPEYTRKSTDGTLVKLWNTKNDTTANIPDKYKLDLSAGYMGCSMDIIDYNNVPLFLRFDEYQSRSKVIFSSCDKTRNPDVDFSFGYHKGQIEPIKLNLSLSAGVPVTGYNQNLSKSEIESILKSCYWCIEWICDKDAGN